MLAIGTKVYSLFPLTKPLRQGIIYDYLPHRQWPYHVRLDGWPQSKPGIAYTEAELASVDETGGLQYQH